jgi:hypothetical protein
VNEQPFENEDQHLQPAWLALEQRLRAAEMVGPRPGFSQRWLARYKAQPVTQSRTVLLAFANCAATLALFALLLPGLQPYIAQPGSLLASVAEWVTNLWAAALIVLKSFASVASVVPAAAWLVIGSSLLSILMLLALLFSKMNWIKGEMK